MQQDINNALHVLQKGGIILYPTDTIWGIGCDATNEEAVAKVYKIKQRQESKSLIILLDDAGLLNYYLDRVPPVASQLIEVADKPLTIVYPGAKNLAPNVIADDGTVAIRIVKEKFCHELIKRFNNPIVSTSANISGTKSPSGFAEIDVLIKQNVDYVVSHKQNQSPKQAKPSSIIKLWLNNEFEIIRP
jgi:L-threonylcarbamoyladenylate synthase